MSMFGFMGGGEQPDSPKDATAGLPKMDRGGKLVNSTDFDVSIFELVSEIFPTPEYYRVFLETRNDGETNVCISDWGKTPLDMYIEGEDTDTYTRQLDSNFPLPASAAFPFLPKETKNRNIQTLTVAADGSRAVMLEKCSVKGIPFVDPTIVNTWFFTRLPNGGTNVTIRVVFEFQYETWLNKPCEYQAYKGLVGFTKRWNTAVSEEVKRLRVANSEIDTQGDKNWNELLPAQLNGPDNNELIAYTPPTDVESADEIAAKKAKSEESAKTWGELGNDMQNAAAEAGEKLRRGSAKLMQGFSSFMGGGSSTESLSAEEDNVKEVKDS